MKKICFVAEYMYCGGSEKSLVSLLNCIDRDKYQITLLLLGLKGVLLSQLPDDIRVEAIPLPEDERDDLQNGRSTALKHAFQSGHILSGCKKALRGVQMACHAKSGTAKRLWYYKSIENKIDEYPEEFDVVIDYFGYGLFNTFYAARKVRAKTKISWVHFEPEQAMPDFTVFEDILNEFQFIMCVSNPIKEQMQAMMPRHKDRMRVFYNIVDAENILEQGKKNAQKKADGATHILSVGRIDFPKGFDLGLGIIERLVADGYSIQWHIVGEGPQRMKLEQQIAQSQILKDCVQLHGQQLNPYAYMDMCDIYFQPSRHEAYGIAVAEARVFCKPIVVTDFAGAREQLVNGVTGLITKCTEDDLYWALKKVLDDPGLQLRFSQNLLEQRGNERNQVKYLEEIFDRA